MPQLPEKVTVAMTRRTFPARRLKREADAIDAARLAKDEDTRAQVEAVDVDSLQQIMERRLQMSLNERVPGDTFHATLTAAHEMGSSHEKLAAQTQRQVNQTKRQRMQDGLTVQDFTPCEMQAAGGLAGTKFACPRCLQAFGKKQFEACRAHTWSCTMLSPSVWRNFERYFPVDPGFRLARRGHLVSGGAYELIPGTVAGQATATHYLQPPLSSVPHEQWQSHPLQQPPPSPSMLVAYSRWAKDAPQGSPPPPWFRPSVTPPPPNVFWPQRALPAYTPPLPRPPPTLPRPPQTPTPTPMPPPPPTTTTTMTTTTTLPPLPAATAPPTAASFAALTLGEQREVLGESLFPLVLGRVGERAGKVTGMLLQSADLGALLAMIQGPPPLLLLDEAVAEAVCKLGGRAAKFGA